MKRMMRLLVSILAAAILITACDDTPDEEQIAQNIAAMQEAIENKDFSAISDHLHPGFIANEQLDVNAVKRLLQMYSLRHKNIGATIISSNTTMDPTFPDRAATVLSVVVTGSVGRLPSDASARTVKLEWLKESGDWLVRKAQWRQY